MNNEVLIDKIIGILYSYRGSVLSLVTRLGMGYITEEEYYVSLEKLDEKTYKDISKLWKKKKKKKKIKSCHVTKGT